jgi:hypothetical protein
MEVVVNFLFEDSLVSQEPGLVPTPAVTDIRADLAVYLMHHNLSSLRDERLYINTIEAFVVSLNVVSCRTLVESIDWPETNAAPIKINKRIDKNFVIFMPQ